MRVVADGCAAEDDNEIVRTWAPEGVTPEGKEKDGWIPHHGVLARLAGYDSEVSCRCACRAVVWGMVN